MKRILLSIAVAFAAVFTTNAQWQTVGIAGFSPGGAGSVSLAFNSKNEPHVAFRDGTNWNKATVMTFDGTNWEPLGTVGFTTGFAPWTSLAFNDSDVPFLAFRDDANGEKITVMKFNGTEWEVVGEAGFSGVAQADFIRLVFNKNNEPYVAYKEYNATDIVNKASVMKFDGTNWVSVGNAGFSESPAGTISLAFNSKNEPCVAFRDGGLAHKATVMKFD